VTRECEKAVFKIRVLGLENFVGGGGGGVRYEHCKKGHIQNKHNDVVKKKNCLNSP